MNPSIRVAVAVSLALTSSMIAAPATHAETPAPVMTDQQYDRIAPYLPRFGRPRPVIAIIGENSGTELADFVIPYGVLARSGAAQVITVATQAGPIKMTPALTVQPDTTVTQFDRQFPDGADYVIVPAVRKSSDPALLAWITAQAARGATVISICDGAVVVANTGLMKGRRATAHWASRGYRRKHHPEVNWVRNVRYVVDGKIVSSAGISAGMPTALALVEAIAGHDAAEREASELGVADWSTTHNSDAFEPRLATNLMPLIAVTYTNSWFRTPDRIGLPVSDGTDDIALAFTADAWSRTGLSHAYATAASLKPVTTRYGLKVLPDEVAGTATVALPALDDTTGTAALDKALEAIAARYHRGTAYGVALDLEYPGFHR